ncbi:MAG TPA: hypothetical protein VK889_04995 [Solirubrobacterales bacterium]|nr:hypothetical protein [Solirubrobacterales bacterium]
MLETIPVTALPRTLLDEAAARPRRLKRMLVRAEELRLFDLRQVDALLARSAGHPGAGALCRAIEVYRPTSFTRSGLEERFLALVIEAGLPRPRTNFVEAGFELDAYWPEERFGVELDTYATHGGHESFESDRRRHDDLQLAGIEMIRVTDVRLAREPADVVGRLRLHLRRRRRERGLPSFEES